MSIPKLRFPEFSTDPDWQEKRLLDVAIPVEEKAGPNKHILMSVTAGVGLVSQLDKFGREIAGNAYKNYYVIKKGDFAYNKSATKQYPEGYIARLLDHETAALPNSIFTCFRVNDPDACPDFFDHLFHDNFHGKWLRKFIAVGARAHGSLTVDSDDLMRMPVLLPKLHEQQKIADCLSSLDDLISAHNQMLFALKTHKKGLMQQLFPAEGVTVPRLRFPEFRDDGEWELSALGDLVNISTGKKNTQDKVDNGKYPFFVRSDNVERINTYSFDGEAVLTAGDGVGVGKVFHYINGKFDVHQRVYKLTGFSEKVMGKFLYEVFRYTFGSRVKRMSAKNSVDSVRLEMIADMPIYLPCVDEQKYIVNCLSHLDGPY